MTRPPQLLGIRALSKTYHAGLPGCTAAARAIDEVDVDVGEGEVVALVGPAGAGKTTLLLCAAGLLSPDAGTIEHECIAAYFREVVHANVHADAAPWELALIDNVDRVRGDVAAAFALLCAARRARETGGALLIAARDAHTVAKIADRMLLLDRGRLQQQAPTTCESIVTRVAENTIR